jgi:predicted component of type VI protein secretion system
MQNNSQSKFLEIFEEMNKTMVEFEIRLKEVEAKLELTKQNNYEINKIIDDNFKMKNGLYHYKKNKNMDSENE